MLGLSLASRRQPIERVLAIGCHADDIEIGCGGTLLTLTRTRPDFMSPGSSSPRTGLRADEARGSADAFLGVDRTHRRSGARASARASFPTREPT